MDRERSQLTVSKNRLAQTLQLTGNFLLSPLMPTGLKYDFAHQQKIETLRNQNGMKKIHWYCFPETVNLSFSSG